MKIIWVKDQKEEWLRQEGRQSVCPEQVPEEKGGQAGCLPRAGPRGERRAGRVFAQSRSPRRKEGRQSLPRAGPRGEEGLLCGVHSDGVWSLGLMPA